MIRHPNNLEPVRWREMWDVIKSSRDLQEYLEEKNPEIAKELNLE
jgi:hypothetical protein